MKIAFNQDLTHRNTFRMRVSCACLVEYGSIGELEDVFSRIGELPHPVLHIGGGSNLLFTGDFPGTVFHSNITSVNFPEPDGEGVVLAEAGAGVIWDDFCAQAAARGLWGPENLSGIPGETGAAAVQNIGAYGVEVKDLVHQVNCFDTVTRKLRAFKTAECGYGYRESVFKKESKGRYIVTSVVFRLSSEARPRLDYGHIRTAIGEAVAAGAALTPQTVRNVIAGIRNGKLPDPAVLGSAGSFFKNPVVPESDYARVLEYARSRYGEEAKVPHYDMGSGFIKIPAAWLIEQCGWKGYRSGNAGVYEKQPLVIVNATGNAEPEEILALEDRIVASVRDVFGIGLSPEVEHVPCGNPIRRA